MTDHTRKKVVSNFFTGAKIFTGNQQMVDLVRSPNVQKEFCDYLNHTSRFSPSFTYIHVLFIVYGKLTRSN